jgi:hypothetical protein
MQKTIKKKGKKKKSFDKNHLRKTKKKRMRKEFELLI